MLSVFPQILFLAPIGTALLRVAGGLALLYIAWHFYSTRGTISKERFPIIGTCPEWLSIGGSFIYFIIGTFMLVGLYAQIAAILGAIIALKSALYAKRYPAIIPLPLSANLLLLAIMLSLVVSGAGAFAFDLPL